MDLQVALILGQDGVVNGAVYGLMAVALVLVFSVTRVIFIPQGELVAFAALSMAALQAGRAPQALWLLLPLAAATLATEAWRSRRGARVDWRSTLAWTLAAPALASALAWWRPASPLAQALTTLAVVVPLGPLLYRLAFRPLADATVLTLLIVSVALHGVLVGLGLFLFGAEGSRTTPFTEARFELGGQPVTGQSLVVVAVALALVGAMALFFERTVPGKALRATAMNRLGARLMGHPDRPVGRPGLRAGRLHRRGLGAAGRPHDHGLLRHRLPHRPEGVRGRHRGRARQLPAGAGRRAAGGAARGLRLLLRQRLQGGAGLHPDPPGALVALHAEPARRGRGVTRRRLTLLSCAALALAWGWLPDFTVSQLASIGLGALAVTGLVLLTGVGGMTSFGQAAVVGIGAYATAWLCTSPAVAGLAAGRHLPATWLPWAGLLLGLLVTAAVAWSLGAVTVKLSGHYLPLGTIAWGMSLYFLFGNLEPLGGYTGLSGVPPLTVAGWALASPRALGPDLGPAAAAAAGAPQPARLARGARHPGAQDQPGHGRVDGGRHRRGPGSALRAGRRCWPRSPAGSTPTCSGS